MFFSFGCWIGASWIAGILYLLILFGFGKHVRPSSLNAGPASASKNKPAAAQPGRADHGDPPVD
jgi:hypothetical protein